MLTIHEGFPIKKMALFGSAAFIVGFTGTLTMLREYAPKDESGNISVVHPSNKQDSKSNVSNQVPKDNKASSDSEGTPNAATPLVQSAPVASGGVLSTRQASPAPLATSNGMASGGGAMTVTPAAPAPAPTVSSAPQPATSSGSTTTATTQPAPVYQAPPAPAPQPSGSLLPSTSGLQDTVDGVTKSTTNLLP